jgi:hypothetical protein
MRMPTRLFIAFLFLFAGTSCLVPNKAYRRGQSVVPKATVPSSPSPGASSPSYDLAYLEFDDMGEFWTIGDLQHFESNPSAAQLSQVLQLIQKRKETGDVVVITFIHGWHNNASPYDERQTDKVLSGFKKILAELSAKDTARSYIGVFVGWRGEVLKKDPFITYWNRRDAAVRVGGPSLSEAIFRLMFLTKGSGELLSSSNCQFSEPEVSKSRFIIVGHSFGGRVLERAVAQPFMTMLLERYYQVRNCQISAGMHDAHAAVTFRSPADLIVFLNPANDAFESKAIIEGLKRMNLRVDRQRYGQSNEEKTRTMALQSIDLDSSGPLLLSVTSQGDWATGLVMPIAQSLSVPGKSFRPSYDENGKELGQLVSPTQSYYFSHSDGNVPGFITHDITGPAKGAAAHCPGNAWPNFEGKDGCYTVHAAKNWNTTPFWIIKVPKSVEEDHNDIFNPGLDNLLGAIVQKYALNATETHLLAASE